MIPKSKLVLNGFDFGAMTLEEIDVFATPQPGENIFDKLMKVRQLLLDYSSWTRTEVMALTVAELDTIAPQLGKALQESAIPKVNGRPSKTGRGKKRQPLPAG